MLKIWTVDLLTIFIGSLVVILHDFLSRKYQVIVVGDSFYATIVSSVVKKYKLKSIHLTSKFPSISYYPIFNQNGISEMLPLLGLIEIKKIAKEPMELSDDDIKNITEWTGLQIKGEKITFDGPFCDQIKFDRLPDTLKKTDDGMYNVGGFFSNLVLWCDTYPIREGDIILGTMCFENNKPIRDEICRADKSVRIYKQIPDHILDISQFSLANPREFIRHGVYMMHPFHFPINNNSFVVVSGLAKKILNDKFSSC